MTNGTEHLKSAIEVLDTLIGYDTVSANSNLPLIVWIAEYLDSLGASVHLIHDEEGGKANLFATLGPDAPGGYALSGHTDVVPVDGQPWDTDPFELHDAGEHLFGRGTCDMKGFIACALALARTDHARALDIPIHFAFSYDEEVGCVGVRGMLEAIGKTLPKPELVIIGEPTEMKVVNAHKGISQQTTTVTGKDAHSSRPDIGVSAVAYAAEIVAFLNRLAEEMAARPDNDPRFDPPGTTFNIGTIQGGTAVNIIARQCSFRWEFRPAPGFDAADVFDRLEAFVATDILPRMRAIDPDASVETEIEVTAPTLTPMDASPAVALAQQITGDNEPATVSFVTEAGLFQDIGIPAVVCGPGSVAQAHQPNEFVTRDQLARCLVFLDRVYARAASAS